MKIAFIGQKGIPVKFGGVERHVEEIAKGLVKNGHEVFVYVRDNYTDKNVDQYEGIKLVHLPSIPTKHLDAISHTFMSTWHAIFSDYDIIHYHSIGPASLSFLIKIFKRKTVLVVTYHSQDYFHKKWGFFARAYLRFSEYLTCKVPDKTIVVSRGLAEYIKLRYGKAAEHIPNGAAVRQRAGDTMLSQWGIEKDKYVVTVSRLIRHKGIHFLIDAWKKIARDKEVGMKLVIVGDGFHTDDYVGELKAMASGHNDIIFTGPLTGQELDEVFSNAFLFVQPSESEGLSLALLEAMGYGLPVLASDIPENLEGVGETGFTFRSGDVLSLQNNLEKLLADPAITEAAGEKARQRIIDHYSWEAIVSKIEKIYQEMVEKKDEKKLKSRELMNKEQRSMNNDQ